MLAQLSAASDNVIEDAMNLLYQMYCATLDELKAAKVGVKRKALEKQLESMEQKKMKREQQCSKMDGDIELLRRESEKNENFIVWLNNRIDANIKRIRVLQEQQ